MIFAAIELILAAMGFVGVAVHSNGAAIAPAALLAMSSFFAGFIWASERPIRGHR